jgi:uncharacterized protein YoxC
MQITVGGVAFSISEGNPDIIERLNQIMAAIDDLKTAVTNLNTSFSAELAAITAKLGGFAGAVPAADAEAVVTSLSDLQKKIDAETAALTGPPAGP